MAGTWDGQDHNQCNQEGHLQDVPLHGHVELCEIDANFNWGRFRGVSVKCGGGNLRLIAGHRTERLAEIEVALVAEINLRGETIKGSFLSSGHCIDQFLKVNFMAEMNLKFRGERLKASY